MIGSSVGTRYKVAEGSRNEQKAEESSWSDTEDEAERSSQKDKEGINTISGQNSKITKMISCFQSCLTLLSKKICLLQNFLHGQGCHVHLQFTWLTILMISLFRWRGERVWESWSACWWGTRMGCPLPGKEEQRSKPLLFVGMLAVLGAQVSAKDEYKVEAVSYTHLTLPTKRIV